MNGFSVCQVWNVLLFSSSCSSRLEIRSVGNYICHVRRSTPPFDGVCQEEQATSILFDHEPLYRMCHMAKSWTVRFGFTLFVCKRGHARMTLLPVENSSWMRLDN